MVCQLQRSSGKAESLEHNLLWIKRISLVRKSYKVIGPQCTLEPGLWPQQSNRKLDAREKNSRTFCVYLRLVFFLEVYIF